MYLLRRKITLLNVDESSDQQTLKFSLCDILPSSLPAFSEHFACEFLVSYGTEALLFHL